MEAALMKTKMKALTVLVGFVLATATGIAHHSCAAEFDANKPVDLKGTVTKIEWSNPTYSIDVTCRTASDQLGHGDGRRTA